MNQERNINIPLPGPFALKLFALIFLAGILVLCWWYLAHDYQYLAKWYLGLDQDIAFYTTWQQDFFTVSTFHKGRSLSAVSLIAGLIGIIFIVKSLRKSIGVRYQFSLPLKDVWILLGILVFALSQSIWAYGMLEIGLDEVYSAVYCSGIHPFQTISYYMDTNNHILFNILNNIVFHFAEDKVFTGRIISIIAYLLLSSVLYLWIKDVVKNRFIGVLITLAIIYQLTTWGFSVQSRGYEIYLLCQWTSFIALYKFFTTKNKNWLTLMTLSTIAGFYTIPTFLYCYVAIMIVSVFYMMMQRKLDWVLVRHQFIAMFFVFLLYVPVFLFSGVGAITSNRHVVAEEAFRPEIMLNLKMFVNNSFWDWEQKRWPFYAILFLLPLGLFIDFRNKKRLLLGLSYLIIFPTVIAISIVLKKYGYLRNIIWQESIYLCIVLISIYWLLEKAGSLLTRFSPYKVVFAVIIAALLFHEYRVNATHLDYYLYNVSAVEHKHEIMSTMDALPQNTKLYCPNFAIMWHLEAQKRGLHSSVNPMMDDDIMILNNRLDPFPVPAYYRMKKKLVCYILYERIR